MQTVQLLQVTDPHLFGNPSRQLYGVDTSESFRLVLAAALEDGPSPDAIVVTGDIGDDCSAGAYGQLRSALGNCGAPVYVLPGNHDDPDLMATLLADQGFQYCGRARLGGWGLVMLDTHVPGEAHGRLADTELQRLESDLRALGDAPALVCLHHPPVPVGSPWLDGVGLENGAAFLEVLDRNPQVRGVIAGHVHQEFDQQRGAVRLLAAPSTCAQFTPRTQHCVMDSRPPGYRRLTLREDGTLATRVGWLSQVVGRPREENDARRQRAAWVTDRTPTPPVPSAPRAPHRQPPDDST
jgi:Icc protein